MLRSWRNQFTNYESLNALPEAVSRLKEGVEVMKQVCEVWEQLERGGKVKEVREAMRRMEEIQCEVDAYRTLGEVVKAATDCEQSLSQDLHSAYTAFQRIDECTTDPLLREIQEEYQTRLRDRLISTAYTELCNGLEEIHYPLSLPLAEQGVSSTTLTHMQVATEVYLPLQGPKPTSALFTHPIETRLRYHFHSSVPTNRLDKPEWMFKFVLTALSCNLELIYALVRPLSQGPILDLRHHFISTILAFVTQKTLSDAQEIQKIAINSTRTAFFLHYIEESMKFDYAIMETYEWDEGGIVTELMKNKDLLENWLEIDVKFVLIQLESEFEEKKAPWEVGSVTGYVYHHLGQTISLLETVFTRYAMLVDRELRELLLKTTSEKVIPVYFDRCSETYQLLRKSIIAYDSSPEYWTDIVTKLCTLHQTLTTFQEFVTSLPVSALFITDIARGNSTKTGIEDTIQHLFSHSLRPLLGAYKVNSLVVMTDVTPAFAVVLKCIGAMQGVVLKAANEALAKLILARFAEELLGGLEKDLKSKETRLTFPSLSQFKHDTSTLRHLLVLDLPLFMHFEGLIDTMLALKSL